MYQRSTRRITPGDIFQSKNKTLNPIITPIIPIAFKFLYAKEKYKLEIRMELEWTPK
jgi:hypothetical protein